MKQFVLLRFDAPLLSFGAPVVDNYGFIQDFPAASLLTGLLGNALGYEHQEVQKLQNLQNRLQFAVRCDRKGIRITDFQTVFLGQDFLVNSGWTTRGVPEGRAGGSSKGTHIRYRDYWADSVYTISLYVSPKEQSPSLQDIASALQEPARPLFIGRKPCLPSLPIFLRSIQADSLLDALQKAPLLKEERRDKGATETGLPAWWPSSETTEKRTRTLEISDKKDWANQIHTGRRFLSHGLLICQEETDG